MIVKDGDYACERIPNMKGGRGVFRAEHLVSGEMLGAAGRLFARGTLGPGHSVGWHVHEKEMEICYILEGDGTAMEHDGREFVIHKGDVQICPPGCGHAIVNNGEVPLVYLAVVLFPGN